MAIFPNSSEPILGFFADSPDLGFKGSKMSRENPTFWGQTRFRFFALEENYVDFCIFLQIFAHFFQIWKDNCLQVGKIVSGHLFFLEPPPPMEFRGGVRGVWLIRYCLDTAEPPLSNRPKMAIFRGFWPNFGPFTYSSRVTVESGKNWGKGPKMAQLDH